MTIKGRLEVKLSEEKKQALQLFLESMKQMLALSSAILIGVVATTSWIVDPDNEKIQNLMNETFLQTTLGLSWFFLFVAFLIGVAIIWVLSMRLVNDSASVKFTFGDASTSALFWLQFLFLASGVGSFLLFAYHVILGHSS